MATPQVMGVTTGGMYTAGGLFQLVRTPTGSQVIAHLAVLRSLSVRSIAIGVGVLLARRGIPRGPTTGWSCWAGHRRAP